MNLKIVGPGAMILVSWMKSLILFLLFSHVAFSQSGPASVGTSLNNPLWLKANAGTSTTIDGSPISSWTDQSGNSNSAAQATVGLQPLFRSSVINGMPAIQFDNITGATSDVLVVPDDISLDNTAGLTIFAITQPNNLNGVARAIVSKRQGPDNEEAYMLFFLTSNNLFVDIEGTGNRFSSATTFTVNTNYLIGLLYDGTAVAASRVKLYVNETFDNNAARMESSPTILNNLSNLTIGLTNAADGRPYGGHIAEVIIYTKTLNVAERLIVSNYLSAKYGIAILAASDLYAGDNAGNGDYDFEVAGVGTDASGSNLSSSSSITGGMAITQVAGFQNNDYLIFGHQAGQNLISTDVGGMTGSNNSRWSRIWFLNVTNAGASQSVDVTFDISDGGFAAVPLIASNYVLLYRVGQSGNWTEKTIATSITGDRINFPGVTLTTDGYYTIGTHDNINSPLPIQLLWFTGAPSERGTELSWKTETELNNDYFTIERSSDGKIFEKLLDVKGAGNSTKEIIYTATDHSPFQGLSYYRLKQTDFSGVYNYSKIVVVDTDETSFAFKLFPNPATHTVSIRLDGNVGEVRLKIRDARGQSLPFEYSITDSLIIINTTEFNKGLYFIYFTNGITSSVQKLIIL